MKTKPDKRKHHKDPLAEAAGDFISKLYAALEKYMQRSDEILKAYIDKNR